MTADVIFSYKNWLEKKEKNVTSHSLQYHIYSKTANDFSESFKPKTRSARYKNVTRTEAAQNRQKKKTNECKKKKEVEGRMREENEGKIRQNAKKAIRKTHDTNREKKKLPTKILVGCRCLDALAI